MRWERTTGRNTTRIPDNAKRAKNKPAGAGFMHTPCAAGQAGDVAKALFELTV